MNKLLKWILGIFTLIGGLVAIFAKPKSVNTKKLKEKIKETDKKIKDEKKESNVIKKSIESKKKALKELEKQKEQKIKEVSAKEAYSFLKKYAKKGKK
tara:strand:+ start:27 stop:320 length:294 start_codon:yes stop_codon:yes gene_type:complete